MRQKYKVFETILGFLKGGKKLMVLWTQPRFELMIIHKPQKICLPDVGVGKKPGLKDCYSESKKIKIKFP